MRDLWTTRRSNQSILKEINTEYSLQRLMLKLKFQYSGHLMWRADSYVEKTLMLGKIEGRRRRGRQGWDGWMVSPTRWTWVRANSRRWWRTGKPGVLQSMGSQTVGHDWATEPQAPGRAAQCPSEAGRPPSSLWDWSHGFDVHLCPSSDSPASSLSLATAQITESAHYCRSIYPKRTSLIKDYVSFSECYLTCTDWK